LVDRRALGEQDRDVEIVNDVVAATTEGEKIRENAVLQPGAIDKVVAVD